MKKWQILGLAVLSLIVLTVTGLTAWYKISLRPVASATKAAVSFEIKPGEKPQTVAQHLKAAGLIKSQEAFLLYITLHGQRRELQAGTYTLSPASDLPVIADILSQGRVAVHRLVIPEGTTVARIGELALPYGINGDDFNAALSGHYSQSWLADRPPGTSLEGYLFPDSYQIGKSTTAAELVTAMLNNFDRRVVAAGFKPRLAARGLSLHQGLTLASIIEQEVAAAADRPVVAQIFLARLAAGQPLESDVTVHFGADQLGASFDTHLDSLYNTYLHTGLPPGPICNPGLNALEAVASPAQTQFKYFLSGKDGVTHFARTFAEHQANVAKYLR
jgi:UPF0755 protein